MKSGRARRRPDPTTERGDERARADAERRRDAQGDRVTSPRSSRATFSAPTRDSARRRAFHRPACSHRPRRVCGCPRWGAGHCRSDGTCSTAAATRSSCGPRLAPASSCAWISSSCPELETRFVPHGRSWPSWRSCRSFRRRLPRHRASCASAPTEQHAALERARRRIRECDRAHPGEGSPRGARLHVGSAAARIPEDDAEGKSLRRRHGRACRDGDAGDDEAFYRSGYVFVMAPGVKPVTSLTAPSLRTARIGVPMVGDDGANPPPALALASLGLVSNMRSYSVYGDYRQDSPPGDLVRASRAARSTSRSPGAHSRAGSRSGSRCDRSRTQKLLRA